VVVLIAALIEVQSFDAVQYAELDLHWILSSKGWLINEFALELMKVLLSTM
jgi:hypothetical protein